MQLVILKLKKSMVEAMSSKLQRKHPYNSKVKQHKNILKTYQFWFFLYLNMKVQF